MAVKILVGIKIFSPDYTVNISTYQRIFRHTTTPTDDCSNLTCPEINKGTQWMERAVSKGQIIYTGS